MVGLPGITGIRIYVEGGNFELGLGPELREGFGRFLVDLRTKANSVGLTFDVIDAGPRKTALREFLKGVATHPTDFVVLLVDSERPILLTPWKHLAEKPDEWSDPGLNDDHAHFMTECMETWLVVDRAALLTFYGKDGFDSSCLPSPDSAESTSKYNVGHALTQATKYTSVGRYKKRHAFKILRSVDPAQVRSKCQWCHRMFETIESKI